MKVIKGFLHCKVLEYTDQSMELDKLGIENEDMEFVDIRIKLSDISSIELSPERENCALILLKGAFLTINVPPDKLFELL